jgi:septal ring-binding cell division protein DamX
METIRRLSRGYAGITATVALVFALGIGGAYAADKISSKQITASAVKSKHIKDGGVRTNDLAADIEVASARTANTANSAKTADSARAVGPNAVTSASVVDGSLRGEDLADDSVNAAKISGGTVGQREISAGGVGNVELVTGSVTEDKIAPGSVGANELKEPVATRSADGVTINPGQVQTVSVQCTSGKMVVGAGHAWTIHGLTSIIASAPSETNPRRTWNVTGFVPSGAPANTLFAWANCLNV